VQRPKRAATTPEKRPTASEPPAPKRSRNKTGKKVSFLLFVYMCILLTIFSEHQGSRTGNPRQQPTTRKVKEETRKGA